MTDGGEDFDLGKVVGDKGETGDDGNGVASVELLSTSGKNKTYRMTFTDGTYFDYVVKDGSDASVTIQTSWGSTTSDSKVPSEKLTKTSLDGKQATLVSGTNIKTVNNNSLLGSGNIDISSVDIATSWGSTLSDTKVPSEKLTKNSLDAKADSSSLSTVATSGSYADLSNKPTIPSKISDLQNDSDFIETSSTAGLIKNDGTIDTNAYITNSALTNYIQKSNTSGLIKNDGSIDTNTYLTQMKVGSTANYIVYTTTNGVLASKEKLGNINYLGRIGSTANKPLITTTNGEITTGSFGTTANSFCEGNDSRLSDARTPTAHTHTVSNITDFPTIPSKISDLTNDSDFIETSSTSGLVKNDGSIDTNSYLTSSALSNYVQKSSTTGLIKNDGTIDTTAYSTFSGDYDDLTDKPSIPSSSSDLSDGSTLVKKSSTTGLIKNDGTIMTGGTGSSNYAIGNHTHGLISADGEIDDTNSYSGTTFKLIGFKSDATSKKIRALTNVYGRYVIDNTAHSNIGSSVGSHQETINGLIDTALGSKLTATKVTSWSSTVSDSNVPSEKLVKDYVDGLVGSAIQYIVGSGS